VCVCWVGRLVVVGPDCTGWFGLKAKGVCWSIWEYGIGNGRAGDKAGSGLGKLS
jgi:hypothetical protein